MMAMQVAANSNAQVRLKRKAKVTWEYGGGYSYWVSLDGKPTLHASSCGGMLQNFGWGASGLSSTIPKGNFYRMQDALREIFLHYCANKKPPMIQVVGSTDRNRVNYATVWSMWDIPDYYPWIPLDKAFNPYGVIFIHKDVAWADIKRYASSYI